MSKSISPQKLSTLLECDHFHNKRLRRIIQKLNSRFELLRELRSEKKGPAREPPSFLLVTRPAQWRRRRRWLLTTSSSSGLTLRMSRRATDAPWTLPLSPHRPAHRSLWRWPVPHRPILPARFLCSRKSILAVPVLRARIPCPNAFSEKRGAPLRRDPLAALNQTPVCSDAAPPPGALLLKSIVAGGVAFPHGPCISCRNDPGEHQPGNPQHATLGGRLVQRWPCTALRWCATCAASNQPGSVPARRIEFQTFARIQQHLA